MFCVDLFDQLLAPQILFLIALFRGEDSKLIADAIARLGGDVTKVFRHRIYASLHYSKLADLAQLEGIDGIFERQGIVMMGQETSNMMQTGRVVYFTSFAGHVDHQEGFLLITILREVDLLPLGVVDLEFED